MGENDALIDYFKQVMKIEMRIYQYADCIRTTINKYSFMNFTKSRNFMDDYFKKNIL